MSRPSDKMLLPGRDFQLPAKVGDWSPFQLTEYIRALFQNDPTMMPNSLHVEDITVNDNSVNTVIEQFYNTTAYAGYQANNTWDATAQAYNDSQLRGSDAASAAISPPHATTDPYYTFTSYDPWDLNLSTGVQIDIENRIVWTAVNVPYPIYARYNGMFFRTAFSSLGPTITQCAFKLYGPWTPSNRAAVPEVVGAISSDTTTRWKMETLWPSEYSPNGLGGFVGIDYASPVLLLPGTYFSAGIFTFSAGSNLVAGHLAFKTVPGDGGASQFYTAGDGVSQGLTHNGPGRAGSYAVAGNATLPSTLDTTTNYTKGLGSTGNDAAVPLGYIK